MKAARNFGIIAVVALAIVVLPGGGDSLEVVVTTLSIIFFTLIALLGYRLYREHRFLLLESLSDQQRLVLYGSVGGALLTFAATRRLFDAGGGGLLLWTALLGACSYGVVWVFLQTRKYE
jgi:hypothetical protein